MKDYLPYEFPAVIGNDVAGTIEALGEGVDGFSIGDRVFGTMGSKPAIHDGGFAELANPQAAAVAKTPDALFDQDAGSLGVAGTTAMSAVEAVAPREGARVLVVGATGGVGTFAIQLAALRDAHVIASVRPGDEELRHRPWRRRDRRLHGRPRRHDPRALPGRDRRRHRRREPRQWSLRRARLAGPGAAAARPRWSAARGSRRRSTGRVGVEHRRAPSVPPRAGRPRRAGEGARRDPTHLRPGRCGAGAPGLHEPAHARQAGHLDGLRSARRLRGSHGERDISRGRQTISRCSRRTAADASSRCCSSSSIETPNSRTIPEPLTSRGNESAQP